MNDSESPRSPATTETWRSVFNPGRNYHMKGQYFDNVKGGRKSLSIWEQHLKSQEASGKVAPPASSEVVSPDELRTMLSSEHIAKIMDANKDKNVNMHELMKQLRTK